MTEEQLRAFVEFRNLPVYLENDPRAASIADGHVKECCTIDEVQACLADTTLIPLGALRAGPDGQQQVVAYFANKTVAP
ncbi:MAG: hypothetical protein ACJ8C4_01645 [Gemmataceae bacterium]